MPELPEVEVVRLFLDSNLIGKTISSLEIINQKSFIGDLNLIKNQKITKTSRIGKQLSIHLENDLVILFHLKMTGQVIFGGSVFGHPTPKEDKSVLPNKSTRLFFTFSDGTKLFFNDQRKFGWVKIFNQKELIVFQQNLGIDVLSQNFTLDYFKKQLKTSSRPIKTVLLDQSKFAGIGNIYANDSLFLAKIHPSVHANKVDSKKIAPLHSFLIKIMVDSIKNGGSTAKDNKYIHPDGSIGKHQFSFQVYQRDKEPCLVCTTPIKRVKLGGRGTFYCPKCQKVIN